MRKPDWANRLNTYIEQHLNTPFEWGTFDCCLFTADAIQAMTGQDFAAEFRGHYSSLRGSKHALKKYGAGDLRLTIEAKFGPMCSRLCAGRGDIALVKTPLGDALGIVWSGKIWAAAERGLMTLPMSSCLGCWEVPCHQ